MFYHEYGEGTPIVAYEKVDGYNPVWYRVCPKCGKYVTADDATKIPEYQQGEPNATCKKCGRVQMPFAYWWSEEDYDN